ncbi:putative major facilitator superfamily transporter [Ilumatobacter coccineus YM16-304]|uniref:Putative major facilitator superfamily transporter n=1 Tax=Ilumatobacter coccineus (strain NBRC 103263 / KCTC 29153 / YM16-304) TaxID=1313172 RepID=A0A6C7E4Q4_ILUCY|nr:putative major facilitator superfamily transporter [Ilumatobacter coccineus YM16-304]
MPIAYKYRVMAVYIVGLVMTIIDGTIVNVALPTLAREFDVPSTDIEWVSISYLLALASVIPVAGWLGDRFGTKRMFVISLVFFVFGSLLCGISQSLETLIVFRVVQGIGGGLITPIGSAMLFRAFPLEERSTASVGVLSVAIVAPAVGPVLGGVIVDNISWHWIFLVNLPIGAIALLLALLWLNEESQPAAGRFDVAGFVLSATGVSLLIYALSTGPEKGWLSGSTLTAAAIGACSFIAMVVVELRVREPMLKLRLYRDRLFRSVNIASSMIYMGFFGWIFVLPLYMQTLRGFTATESGLAQAPQAAAVFVVSNLLGKRLYRAVGPRRLMIVGSAATALFTGSSALFDLDTPIGVIAATAFMRGASIGMVFVSIQTAVYATVSNADTGRATSVFNTQRQISFATGVALAASVIAAKVSSVGGDAAPAIDRLPAYQWGFLAMGIVMLPAAFASWFVNDDDVAATRGLAPAAG